MINVNDHFILIAILLLKKQSEGTSNQLLQLQNIKIYYLSQGNCPRNKKDVNNSPKSRTNFSPKTRSMKSFSSSSNEMMSPPASTFGINTESQGRSDSNNEEEVKVGFSSFERKVKSSGNYTISPFRN